MPFLSLRLPRHRFSAAGFPFCFPASPIPIYILPTASRLKFSFIFYAHSLPLPFFLCLASRSFGRHNLLTEMENIFDRPTGRGRGGKGRGRHAHQYRQKSNELTQTAAAAAAKAETGKARRENWGGRRTSKEQKDMEKTDQESEKNKGGRGADGAKRMCRQAKNKRSWEAEAESWRPIVPIVLLFALAYRWQLLRQRGRCHSKVMNSVCPFFPHPKLSPSSPRRRR